MVMNIMKYIVNWSLKRNVIILSDGDWDGIVGSALLYKELNKRKIKVNQVDFPSPLIIHELNVSNSIIIELSPSRGYKVIGENLLIDHHDFNGIKHIFPSDEKILFITDKSFSSVAELIVTILNLDINEKWYNILNAVNLIDQGGSRDNKFSWMLHSAYLYNIEDDNFRKKIFNLLTKDRLKDVINICRNESSNYMKAQGMIPKIISRTIKIKNNIAFTWYFNNIKNERIVFREAMFKLEEKYDLVIIASIKNNKIYRLHLGTNKDLIDSSLIAKKIAKKLLEKNFKVTAGGKKGAGGVQIIDINKPNIDEIIEIIKNIIS